MPWSTRLAVHAASREALSVLVLGNRRFVFGAVKDMVSNTSTLSFARQLYSRLSIAPFLATLFPMKLLGNGLLLIVAV